MENTRRNPRNTRKKNKGLSIRMIGLLVLLAVGVIFGIMLMIPAFNITEVYCEGLNLVKNEEVVATAGIENGTNILLANVGGARRSVEKLPMVKEVNVRRVFPNKICISVHERTPAAYIECDGELVLADCDGIVLEKVSGDRAAKIKADNTPLYANATDTQEGEKSEDSSKDTKDKKESSDTSNDDTDTEAESEDDEISEDEEDSSDSDSETDEASNKKKSEQSTEEVQEDEGGYSVPVVIGLSLKEKNDGKVAEAEDSAKLDLMLRICNALNNAELLNRSTQIDLTDIADVTLVVENRLEVMLGTPDNIEYRAKFLAETINTKITSTEILILDYTGNDIYARAHDDGKDRVSKKKKDTDSDKEKKSESKEDESDSNEKTKKSEDESESSSPSSKSGQTSYDTEDDEDLGDTNL